MLLSIIPSINADFGYNNPYLPKIESVKTTGTTTIVNNDTLSVNDTSYWDGYDTLQDYWDASGISTDSLWTNVSNVATYPMANVTGNISISDRLRITKYLTKSVSFDILKNGGFMYFKDDSGNDIITMDGANDRIGIGTSIPDVPLHVQGSSFPVVLVDRQTALSNVYRSAMGVRHTTTNDMLDGFGAGFTLQGEDNAGTPRPFAYVYGVRDGSDFQGKMILTVQTGESTALDAVEIDHNGDVHITEDNHKLYFGSADDCSITYDRNDMVFNPQEVGTGVAKFTPGKIVLEDDYTGTSNNYFLFKDNNDDSSQGGLLVYHDNHPSQPNEVSLKNYNDAPFSFYTDNTRQLVLDGDGNLEVLNGAFNGSSVHNDDVSSYYGTDNDASLEWKNGNLEINAQNIDTSGNVYVISSGGIGLQAERRSIETNAVSTAFTTNHKTTNNMIDGFGAGFGFYIEDSAGVDNFVGRIAAIRDGADNSAKMVFRTYNAGSGVDSVEISPAGNVNITSGSLFVQNNFNVTKNVRVQGCIQYNCSQPTGCVTLGVCI